MPQFTGMDEVVRYDTSNIVEKALTIEISNNYHSISTAVDHLEEKQNGFIGGNDKEKLLPKDLCYLEQKVNLQWRNITLKTEGGTTILNGLHGSARSGELTAIVGPSGAGKTSLLNVLSGFSQKRATGQILVNGSNRKMQSFRRLSSYVFQDGCVLTKFTVRELVTIACRLKIPHTVSEEDKQKAVDNCIFSMGLTLQQNQKVSTLSGGQKKRLYIAQEIVHKPPLIILDEPTSGLDSSSSFQCIQLLKSWAAEGRNIICTIHQPSARICEMFDKFYVVADGDCIYRGSARYLRPFLENQGLKCPMYHNPTDFIIDAALGVYGDWNWKLKEAIDSLDDIKDRWGCVNNDSLKKEKSSYITSMSCLFKKKVKETKKEDCPDMPYKYATSYFNQFRVLVKRSFYNSLRDPMKIRMKFLGNIVFGIFCGSMFYNTGNDAAYFHYTASLLFTILMVLITTTQLPTLYAFSMERTVIEREYFNGWYSLIMYHLAITVAEIPFQIIFPTINCTLIYWLSGQPAEMSRFCLFLLAAVLICFISESIALMIGAGTSVLVGIDLSIMSSAAALLLSGGLLKLSKAPVYYRWLSNISYTKYGVLSMYLILYENRPVLKCSDKSMCLFSDPMKFLKFMDMEGDLLKVYLVLIMFFFCFRFASYLVLYFRVTRLR